MPYKVVRIRRNGRKSLLSEHLHLADAKIKANNVRGTVIVDQQGRVVPYDKG